MSTAIKNPTATHTQEAPATGQKGLAKGQVGLLGTVAIGVGCIAPAYTLTSSLGPTIAEVGIHVPAILILGFIPMLLVAFGYRELNARVPDSGTSFTWATKAFGPTIGWMSGWGLIAATIIVLSNLAAVAVDFLFILLSQIFQNPGISDLTRNLWINIPATLAFIAVAAWLSYRGLTETRVVQYVLVGIQLAVLTSFAIVAVVQSANGTSFDPTPISTEWFNPTGLNSVSMAVAGMSLSIFMFWGWDTTLTMNEETKDPRHTASKASTITVFIIIALYCLVAMSVIAWGGIDPVGLSAGNPDNQESIFAELATPVLGPLSILMSITVLTSAFSSLNSTMISPSRTLLAMGYYKAIPEKFARVSQRFFTPTHATIVSAAAAGVFYAITRILSENALWDTITALGLMICFYYGITSLACVWYFRHECTDSVRNFLFRLLFPLFGGVALLAMFLQTAIDSMDPSYGSGNELGGIGLVFVLGVGVLLIGVALMLLARKSSKDFFNGITLPTTHSADESYSAPDATDKQIPCDFN